MEQNKFGKKELSETQIEKIMKMPTIEHHVKKSVDGKWVISVTKITDIRPTKYYEELLKR